MHLIDDAGRLWHRLWSVRLALLALGFEAIDKGLPYLADVFPPVWFSLITMGVTVGAGIARLVDQPALQQGAA